MSQSFCLDLSSSDVFQLAKIVMSIPSQDVHDFIMFKSHDKKDRYYGSITLYEDYIEVDSGLEHYDHRLCSDFLRKRTYKRSFLL